MGDHVHQAGSFVTPDRLRFDFSHFEKVTAEQIAEIERLVIEKILANDAVVDFETPFDQKPADVLAFFEDKYGDVVRVVDIGGYSKELCAGTHTRTTGEIGFLKVIQESAIAAGSRRIEAVAGGAFSQYFKEISAAVGATIHTLKCQPAELASRVTDLLEERKQLQKQLADLRMGAASKGADSLAKEPKVVNGVKWVVGKLEVANPNELRGMGVRILKDLVKELLSWVPSLRIRCLSFASVRRRRSPPDLKRARFSQALPVNWEEKAVENPILQWVEPKTMAICKRCSIP